MGPPLHIINLTTVCITTKCQGRTFSHANHHRCGIMHTRHLCRPALSKQQVQMSSARCSGQKRGARPHALQASLLQRAMCLIWVQDSGLLSMFRV